MTESTVLVRVHRPIRLVIDDDNKLSGVEKCGQFFERGDHEIQVSRTKGWFFDALVDSKMVTILGSHKKSKKIESKKSSGKDQSLFEVKS